MEKHIEKLVDSLLASHETSDHPPAPRVLGASVPWVMFQSWQRLLFMHWEVPESLIRPLVPDKMELDSFNGRYFITMIPMHMVNVHMRGMPVLPSTGTFPEINFRTYIRVEGEPGIVFLSIDADTPLAVWVAHNLWVLPYVQADATFLEDADGTCHLESNRAAQRDFLAAQFVGAWKPKGEAKVYPKGTLEHFLAERYAMFVQSHLGIVWRGLIHHPPWEIQEVEANIEVNTVPDAFGLDLSPYPLTMAYAHRTDTLCWPMLPVEL